MAKDLAIDRFHDHLHPQLVKTLHERGIHKFYPPQWEAIQPGLNGRNLVVSIPTASGKTLIAEVIALQKLLTRKTQFRGNRRKMGKILYLCPLKALAYEKLEEFKRFWRKLGFRVGVSTSDVDQPDFKVFKNDLIILTNEKADALMRLNPKLINDLLLIICDEIHLINNETRGITLEFLLTQFCTLKPDLQIIGLSATIQNANQLAHWLNASLITSEWRPVELKEGFFLKEEIQFKDGTTRRIPMIPDHDATTALVVDMINEGGQVLVFTNSRRSAMSTAENLSPILLQIATPDEIHNYTNVASEYTKNIQDDTKIAQNLGNILKGGVAFHHAGLNRTQLNFIVDQFNRHRIRVICCTPTLAAGVNTPARRVIIKTLYRYSSDKGSHLIPVIEYKQMAGRAGRPRYDPYGEVVILGSKPDRLIENALGYINGEPEAITSKLADETKLQSHLLGLIAAKLASSSTSIFKFIQKTFYYFQARFESDEQHIGRSKTALKIKSKELLQKHQARKRMTRKRGRGTDPLGTFDTSNNLFQTADEIWEGRKNRDETTDLESQASLDVPPLSSLRKQEIQYQLDTIIQYFLINDLIIKDENDNDNSTYLITKFGKITTQTYLPPQDAVLLREDLDYAERLEQNHEIDLNAISWLHLITKLESSRKFFLRKSDYPAVISFLDQHVDSFIMEEVWQPEDSAHFGIFAQELKLTMILRDWINEKHERNIVEDYNIGPGDLYRVVNTTEWIFRAFLKIAKLDNGGKRYPELYQLYLRIKYGVRQNIIAFIQLKGVGRIRARKLYQNGYKTLTQLQAATIDEIARVPLIGQGIAKSIYAQLHSPEPLDENTTKQKLTVDLIPEKTSQKKTKLKLRKKNTQKKRTQGKKADDKTPQSSLDQFM